MRDLTLSQEYLLCAVNREGKTAPSGGGENGLPGGGGAAGAQLGLWLWTKKYVTVTGPLPEGRRIYGPSPCVCQPSKSRSERRSCWSTPILSPMLSAMSCWRSRGAPGGPGTGPAGKGGTAGERICPPPRRLSAVWWI